MRLIGHLKDEPSARVFGDYLLVQGIDNTVESDHSDGWAVWISEEDKIDAAKELLQEFSANPGHEKFQSEARSASALREEKQREQQRWEKKVKGRRQMFRPMLVAGFGPLTLGLIVACVILYVLMRLSPGAWERWLFIAGGADWTLPEIRHGQIWRLVTPILLHFSIWHILFNMLWLRDLGTLIEVRQGTRFVALLVLGLAVGSNLAQFYIGGSPGFGGMSGVVYGMLGYVWLRGKLDPASGYLVQPVTMMFMMVWFAAAFTGALGNVANWAHAGGLVLGLAWGYASAANRG